MTQNLTERMREYREELQQEMKDIGVAVGIAFAIGTPVIGALAGLEYVLVSFPIPPPPSIRKNFV